MSAVIRFSPDLGSWLVNNLHQGCAPAALIDTMIAQRMEPSAARSIVHAFVAAIQAAAAGAGGLGALGGT